jgi:predicted ABC-type ATPase
VGDALLVGLVLDGHEADAERVQSAVAQQGHHVPAALRVADMRRDVQAVCLRFRVCDAADKLPVLVAELG